MRYFLVYAEQQVGSQPDASSAPSIQAALDAIVPLQNSSCGITINGSWVGAPRITRQASFVIFAGNGRITRFAALFQFPESPLLEAPVRDCIRRLVDLQLPFLGSGWGVSQILDYNPATNGSVDWWANGLAAQTHTQNAFDLNQQTGHTSTIENPIGPTGLTPTDLAPPISIPTIGDFKTVVWIIGGAAALYLFWPVLSGTRAAVVASQRRRKLRSRRAVRESE